MSTHSVEQLRAQFASAEVARLATVSAGGAPHLVPITFVVVGDVLYTAVDHKPKTTRALRRLDNIRATGRASVLVDHYDPDWSLLWWVRLDGAAEVLDTHEGAIAALVAKYPQYAAATPAGPIIAVRADRWSAWQFRP